MQWAWSRDKPVQAEVSRSWAMISFLPPNRLLPKVQGSAQARKHSLAFCSNHQGSLEKVTLRKVENYFPCSSGPSRAMGPLDSARLLCLGSEQAAR